MQRVGVDYANPVVRRVTGIARNGAGLGREVAEVVRDARTLTEREAVDEPAEVIGKRLLLLDHRLRVVDDPKDVDARRFLLDELLHVRLRGRHANQRFFGAAIQPENKQGRSKQQLRILHTTSSTRAALKRADRLPYPSKRKLSPANRRIRTLAFMLFSNLRALIGPKPLRSHVFCPL